MCYIELIILCLKATEKFEIEQKLVINSNTPGVTFESFVREIT